MTRTSTLRGELWTERALRDELLASVRDAGGRG
jgi:hypothetical protein